MSFMQISFVHEVDLGRLLNEPGARMPAKASWKSASCSNKFQYFAFSHSPDVISIYMKNVNTFHYEMNLVLAMLVSLARRNNAMTVERSVSRGFLALP